MNAAISNTGFEDFSIPIRTTSYPLKPIPMIDDPDQDIHLFRVLDRADYPAASAPLPEKRHPVLEVDRMLVSASLIRRIEHELRHDECDSRTVFHSCRGMAKGSLEFEDAYIAARIRSFAKHQRIPIDPLLGIAATADNPPQNPCRNTMSQKALPPPHPLAVYHLGHLMSHLGIWVIALLGVQAWAAWRVSAVASQYLEGGRSFYLAIALFLVLALDSAVWFRRRGNLCDAFFVPGIGLFLMALLPILTLHVREILLAMR